MLFEAWNVINLSSVRCKVTLIGYSKDMDNKWQSYPNQNFDRIQSFALAIADAERKNGRSEPKYGYSLSDWNRAVEMASFRLE